VLQFTQQAAVGRVELAAQVIAARVAVGMRQAHADRVVEQHSDEAGLRRSG
jgi:hypothetical protein